MGRRAAQSLRISGLNELRERLERLRADEVMARALAEQAQRMAARVREGLSEPPGAAGHDEPWLRSGALRDSVEAQADGLQAAVGSSDPAAVPQELGTARMPARPFLAPAAAAMGEEVARAVGAAMAAALRGDSPDVNSTGVDLDGGGLSDDNSLGWGNASDNNASNLLTNTAAQGAAQGVPNPGASNVTNTASYSTPDGVHYGDKINKQMTTRDWTPQEIDDAVQNGQRIDAINKADGGPATRYVNPQTGKSVIIDDVTNEVIQVGGPNFSFGPASGDKPGAVLRPPPAPSTPPSAPEDVPEVPETPVPRVPEIPGLPELPIIIPEA
jgi:hypothetical protein